MGDRRARVGRRHQPQVRRRARPGALPGHGGDPGARRRVRPREADHGRGGPRPRPLLRLVRAVPALVGRHQGRRGARPGDRRPRLRRPVPAAVPPDRRQQAQGPQQQPHRRPRRPRQPVRHRRRRGRPLRRPPRAGHRAGRPRPVRHRPQARDGRGAGHRAQRVRRPPVAHRAPRVVPAAPRRHAQVRREPAQALPGHLQLQLGHRRVAVPVERLARRVPALGGLRHQVLPGRQPAHQAVRVLGVDHQGGPQGRPRRGLPVARPSRAEP